MEIEGLDEKILHKKRLHITELICWSSKCLKLGYLLLLFVFYLYCIGLKNLINQK